MATVLPLEFDMFGKASPPAIALQQPCSTSQPIGAPAFMDRLVIFDFDHSLIDDNSDTLVVSVVLFHPALQSEHELCANAIDPGGKVAAGPCPSLQPPQDRRQVDTTDGFAGTPSCLVAAFVYSELLSLNPFLQV